MDSSVMVAIVGPIIGGACALVGGIGTAIWEQRRAERGERVKRRQLVDNVRLLLHLEMQRNLDAVARVWSQITLNLEGGPDEMELERLMRFVGEPLPMWTTLMWEGQIEHLAVVLTTDEIRRATDIHDKLDLLREYHGSMVRELPDNLLYDFESWFANPQRQPIRQYGGLSKKAPEYLARTEKLWQRCKGIMNELAQLQSGNPITWSEGKK